MSRANTGFRFPLGSVHGRLTVLSQDLSKVVCSCSCGSGEREYLVQLVKAGNVRSCGCLSRERTRAMGLICKHGRSKTAEFHIWSGMKGRCHNLLNKDYPRYGGRGIYVCDRWRHSFENFLADMGERPSPKHSLDRYPDNDGPYAPDNCRWATMKEQNRNRRNTRRIVFEGEEKALVEWCEHFSVSLELVADRLDAGWAIGPALRTPKDATRGVSRHEPQHPAYQPGAVKRGGRTAFGKCLTLSEWAVETGLALPTLEARIKTGWALEEALTIKPGMRTRWHRNSIGESAA